MGKIKWKKVGKGLFGWFKVFVVWSLRKYLLEEHGLDISAKNKPSGK